MSENNERLINWEERTVSNLCEKIGYGRVMQLAEHLWSKKSEYLGLRGSNHTVGPCAALLVECGCESGCDWCAGVLRVTKRVKRAKTESPGGGFECVWRVRCMGEHVSRAGQIYLDDSGKLVFESEAALHTTQSDALKAAEKAGWSVDAKQALCPECRDEMEVQDGMG